MSPAPLASAILIERLRALLQEQHLSPYAVSLRLGWAKGQMAAKLAPQLREDGTPTPGWRPTSLAELDLILNAIGKDATALLGSPSKPRGGAVNFMPVPKKAT